MRKQINQPMAGYWPLSSWVMFMRGPQERVIVRAAPKMETNYDKLCMFFLWFMFCQQSQTPRSLFSFASLFCIFSESAAKGQGAEAGALYLFVFVNFMTSEIYIIAIITMIYNIYNIFSLESLVSVCFSKFAPFGCRWKLPKLMKSVFCRDRLHYFNLLSKLGFPNHNMPL